MHELGIVFHIIKEVDKIAEDNHVDKVTKVTLEIGEVSGIVPSYRKDCWNWAVENRSKHRKGCKLDLEVIKAISYCNTCKKTYPTTETGKKCPYCKGDDTYLVSGNEASIKNIEVE